MNRSIFVGQGLMAARQIDDRQPGMSQSHMLGQKESLVIRTPMRQRFRHSPQGPHVQSSRVLGPFKSGDAAHDSELEFPL
jgi:hypothetical protein